MKIKRLREQDVLQEALEILVKHMEPVKVAFLLSTLQAGKGDYLAIREQLFSQETVNSLVEKVQAYQQSKSEK